MAAGLVTILRWDSPDVAAYHNAKIVLAALSAETIQTLFAHLPIPWQWLTTGFSELFGSKPRRLLKIFAGRARWLDLWAGG